ncbi:hypothetical protein SAURM35S_09087 [Streptomyces aurantiogriseus]
MLMRTDPFREFDRLAQQVFGTANRPAAMAMDAYGGRGGRSSDRSRLSSLPRSPSSQVCGVSL